MLLNDILNALARQSRALEAQAEKLAAERDYSAEFPACDAEALRAAHSMLCRMASGNPAGTPDLPPPFDSQEEAQRAAGIWPQEAETATVRVAPKPSALDEMAARAASWRVGVDLARDGADAMAYMLRSHGKPIDFKNHQWIGIAIDHATKWKTAGGLQNLLMAKHYLDKLIELEGKAS